mmetsp:Transcript_22868/g.22130  ORF Transcript_22868/g.22130 Transcript_22868/m.22130 type:complete len:151 (+) Transcript_22868:1555-2007(+)
MCLLTDCGNYGKTITEDQMALLTQYLQEDPPGEISYNKLYLSFTLGDRDAPLKQHGTEHVKKYEEGLRKQMTMGKVPLEVIDLLHDMEKHQFTVQQVFKRDKGTIPRAEFEMALRSAGYASPNINALIGHLTLQGSQNLISLDKLNQYVQ